MPKKKAINKYYLVLSKSGNYTYGAFPFSEEGLKLARKYISKNLKSSNEKFYIAEK